MKLECELWDVGIGRHLQGSNLNLGAEENRKLPYMDQNYTGKFVKFCCKFDIFKVYYYRSKRVLRDLKLT